MWTFFYILTVSVGVNSLNYLSYIHDGLDKNLNYLEHNVNRVNIDCTLGVVFAKVFLEDVQNFDYPTENLFSKMDSIIKKSKERFIKENSTLWAVENILSEETWRRDITFKNNSFIDINLNIDRNVMKKIFTEQKLNVSTDKCFKTIITDTANKQRFNLCDIGENCLNNYIETDQASGYILTHRLMLLQFMRARKCYLNQKILKHKIKSTCFLIYRELKSAEYYGELNTILDLMLEQIVLCGYEGYKEFLQIKYLEFILHSQKSTGCFAAFPLKNRAKRFKKSIQYFEDGCADHTTGLATAVLSLYYNYVTKL